MAGFSHSCHDDATGRVVDEFAGHCEGFVEARAQRIDGAGLDFEHLARESDQLVVVQVFRHSLLCVAGRRPGPELILNLLRMNAATTGVRAAYRFCVVR